MDTSIEKYIDSLSKNDIEYISGLLEIKRKKLKDTEYIVMQTIILYGAEIACIHSDDTDRMKEFIDIMFEYFLSEGCVHDFNLMRVRVPVYEVHGRLTTLREFKNNLESVL